MKRLILLVGMVVAQALIFATPVSQSVIFTVAENWIEMKSSSVCSISDYVIVADSLSTPLYYKIDFQPDGFVIVAADDSSIPILGYSVTGSILGSSNPARDNLLNEYSNQIIDIKTNNRSNSGTNAIWASILNQSASTTMQHSINLDTEWDQSAPYNDLCPMDLYNGGRSLVGCTATATAQIINYHKLWEYEFADSDDYTYTANNIQHSIDDNASALNFPNFSTLNTNLVNVVNNFRNGTPLTNVDKASLSFGTGILEHTLYRSTSSSAGNYAPYYAFQALNYDCSCADRTAFNNDVEWINILKGNIASDKPIQYRGAPVTGSGHYFILYGYQENSNGTIEFLVNWGWGPGYNDEYYTLDALNPPGHNY